MVELNMLKPKLEFPKEYTDAPTVLSTDLIGKVAFIKSALPYTKEGVAKCAFLLTIEGKTLTLYTQAKALVEVGEAIAVLGDEFDGCKVRFVAKKTKSGKDYIDMEAAE